MCDLNISPNDYYLASPWQGVTHAYIPPKFGRKYLLKIASPTEQIMKWSKLELFDLV